MKEFRVGQKVRLKKNVGELIRNKIEDYNRNPTHYNRLINSFTKNIGTPLIIKGVKENKYNWFSDIPIKDQKFYKIKNSFCIWSDCIPECFIENFSDKIDKLLKL